MEVLNVCKDKEQNGKSSGSETVADLTHHIGSCEAVAILYSRPDFTSSTGVMRRIRYIVRRLIS